jgi:hypothetical protein
VNWGPLSPELRENREEMFERVADAFSRLLAAEGLGNRSIARLLGRDCRNSVTDIVSGQNVSIALLADIAHVAGYDLDVRFTKRK